ncbi:MAG: lysophospholipid acyltransferase family protein [Planctomycetota bacterium]
MPQPNSTRRTLGVSFIQGLVRWFFRILLTIFYRVRVHGLKNYPKRDGFLVCSNHQSFLDPIVLGVVCPRPVNYLGRKTLFRFPPLALFLSLNDTIPIDRDANSIGGMKETMRRLKKGESVVMFPEGTRSGDGELQPLLPGFCPLARRTKAALMPIGIAGAFQAYPRDTLLPKPGFIHAVMGSPILYSQYQDLTDDEVTELLANRIQVCFESAKAHWQHSTGNSSLILGESDDLRPAEVELL